MNLPSKGYQKLMQSALAVFRHISDSYPVTDSYPVKEMGLVIELISIYFVKMSGTNAVPLVLGIFGQLTHASPMPSRYIWSQLLTN